MVVDMYLRPVPGLVVLDPETGEALPDKGKEIKESKIEPQLLFYWRKRLKDRSVTLGEVPLDDVQLDETDYEEEAPKKGKKVNKK
jgi:hypothetical protein